MAIDRVEQLRVYQRGFESAMRIFEVSRRWPKEERYALTDQIRRSSRSVCSNLAEAWRKRRYLIHFVSKLSDADMEAGETRTWLRFANRCGYLAEQDYRQLDLEYDAICGGLVNMMNAPQQWCLPPRRVSEPAASYGVDGIHPDSERPEDRGPHHVG